MQTLRNALLRVGLALAGVIVALGLVELGFHAYYFVHPSNAKGFFWVPNQEYGWGLAPGRARPYYDDHGEYQTQVRINSLGLHDFEHSYKKDPGVFRILVLGDSYIEALQVELEQGFGRLLQNDLTMRAGRPVEVISAGVSAWGTDSELLYFRNEGYKYHPDLVLLAFMTANDIRENYEPFDRMAAKSNLAKPTFVLSGEGTLELRPGPPPKPQPWWQKLYIGEYINERLGGKVELPGSERKESVAPSDPKLKWVPADMWVYAPQYPAEVMQAWEITKPLVRTLRDQAIAHGAKFAVIVHNGPWVYDQDRWRFMLMRDPEAARTWEKRKPERLVNMFCLAERIPVLDLFDAFDAAKNQEQLFFRLDPHWTPAGHRVAAQAVADYLLSRGLVPRGGDPAPQE